MLIRGNAYASSWPISVAMLMRLLGPISVFFRVRPWQCLCVFLAYFCGYADASSWSYFRVNPWQIISSDCFYIR